MKMPCRTYQTHDDSEVWTSSRSIRKSSPRADIKITCQNWKNLSLDLFINGFSVVTVSSQETTSVRCQQGSRNTGKLFHASMETCQMYRKPSRYWHKLDAHRKPLGVRVAKRAGMTPDKWRKVVPSERSWSWQATSTVATETELDQLFDWRRYNSFIRIRTLLPTAWGSRWSRRDPSSRANISFCTKQKLPECFNVDSKQKRNLNNIEIG